MNSNTVDTSLCINLNVRPSHDIHETPPDQIMQELNRVNSENKKLSEMLGIVCKNYIALQKHFNEMMQNNTISNAKKRKAEEDENYWSVKLGNTDCSYTEGSSPKRPKEITTNSSRVYVRTDPDDKSLIVQDGYQWRKYGQKVTRDNPSPRAYYKCSFAPSCSVKKKVQRSIEDPCVLVACYEGEHNHSQPSQAAVLSGFTQVVPGSSSISLGPSTIHNSTEPGLCRGDKMSIPENNVASRLETVLVEQMASSLTRNPSFTAALAEVISNKILDYDLTERW